MSASECCGLNGDLNGLIHNAGAFNRGSIGLTALDSKALGIAQLVASEYDPSGFVINPADWYSSNLLLAKGLAGSLPVR